MKTLFQTGLSRRNATGGRRVFRLLLPVLFLALGLSARGEPDFTRWRQQRDRYVQGMADVQRELAQWRAETEEARTAYNAEPDPLKRVGLSKQLADAFLAKLPFEDTLKTLDLGNRLPLMSNFVAHVQGRLGEDGLKYTGGTPPDGPDFRHGYGDFDLETLEAHAGEIRGILDRFAGDIHETNDYLAVEALRVTIFKRREIRTLADVEGDLAAIERAAQDPEIYLHIRLAAAEKGGRPKQAYADAVKALEIQGHIKKGLAGVGMSPATELLAIEHLYDLQFLAKSVMKSLEAAGLGGEGGSAEMVRVAGEAGLTKPLWLSRWINKLRGAWYYNPYGLGLDDNNVAQFQQATRRLLRLAGKRADDLAEGARKVLAELRADGLEPDLQVKLEVALRLYGIQAGINRGELAGLPAGDTAADVLAFFELPEEFEVQSAVWGMAIQGAGRSYSSANSSPRGFTASWKSPPADVPAAQPLWGDRRKTETTFSIRVAVAQFASDTEAMYAYRSGYVPRQWEEEKAAQEKQAMAVLQAESRWIGTTETVTNAHLAYPAKLGAGVQTDSRGGARQELTSDAVGPNGVWAGRRHRQSILREHRQTAEAEMLNATPERLAYLDRMRLQAGSVEAQYRTRTVSVRTVADPEMLERETWQGFGRLGRCLVLVELDATYGHEKQKVGQHGTRIVKDAASLPSQWEGIPNRFRRLMGRPAKLALAATVRLAGRDGEFKGVAADGVSTLELVADVVGDEESLAQIASTHWEVRHVPGSFNMGEIRGGGSLEESGKNRRRVAGKFHPPEEAPREHRENVRLVVAMKDGTCVTSPYVPIEVIPPPILLIHGLWSDSRAMAPLQEFLIQQGVSPRRHCVAVDYGSSSARNPLINARAVRTRMLGVLLVIQAQEKIKAARVNIVAHSLGGLLARIVILGRSGDSSLPGDGDKVCKLITIATPHHENALADWYSAWNPDLFTDKTDPSLKDFNNLQANLRTLGGMRPEAFTFGPALLALRTGDNLLLKQLSKAQVAGPHPHIRYYCVAGTVPFISRDFAGAAAVMIYNGTLSADLLDIPWPINMANYVYSGLKSQNFKQMVTEACDLISDPATDGVVPVHSAIPGELRRGLAGKLEVPQNHFDVMADPAVIARVQEWLTGGAHAGRRWTWVASRSPGSLHVYDAEGRHVGRTAAGGIDRAIPGSVHVPYADPMGEHEVILLPGGEDVRVEFEATEAGRVTIASAQASEAAVISHAFRRVRVEPQERIRFETARPGETARRVAVDKTETPLEAVSARWESQSERPETIPLTAGRPKPRENRPPEAKFSFLPAQPRPGEPVVVVATPSDPDGDRLAWRWFLDDRHLEEWDRVRDLELSDLSAGTYRLRLEVSDVNGRQTSNEKEIVVSGEAVAVVELPNTAQAAYAYSLECHERLKAVMADDPRGISEEARKARRRYDEALRHYQGLLQAKP